MKFYPLVDEKPTSCESCPFYTETLGNLHRDAQGRQTADVITQCNLTFFKDYIYESCPLIAIGEKGVHYVE